MTPESAPARKVRIRLILTIAALLFVAEAGIDVYAHISGETLPYAAWLRVGLIAVGLLCLLRVMAHTPHQPLPEAACQGISFAHLPQPAIVVDRQGIICDLNQPAAQLINQSVADLIGQPVHTAFHPVSASKMDCLLCRHIAAGRELAATDFAFPQQHWRQVSLSRLPHHAPALILESHFDISARKRIEQQMTLVIDGAGLGFWDWDYVTGKHEVNQRWLDMLGLQQDELDHYVSDWDHRIHPEDHDRVRDLIARHIASGTPYVVEFRMQHKDGHWVWIQGSGSVVEHDPLTGQPKRLCGTHQDISARKQFEQNLQAAYQVISQSSSVVLKWRAADGLPIEFATDNVLPLLGYSHEQLTTARARYLELIHPHDLPVYREELDSCRSNSQCTEITHEPYRLMSPNGSFKWVQDHKVISRNEQGQAIGYQGLVTDITRQRQQNSAIRNIISSSLENAADATLDNFSLLAAETLGADYTLIGEISPQGACKILSFCTPTPSADPLPYNMHPSVCAHLAEGKIRCHRQRFYSHFPEDAWLTQHNIQGFIGIPLQNDRHRTSGYVMALYKQPIPDTQFAEDILKLFAAQITSELERNRAIQALEFQKQRLLDAQSISHIGDWQWHWSDNHFSWSDEMYRITGTHRSNFIPSFASFLTQLVHPDDRNLFKISLQNTHNNDIIDFRHRIALSSGEIRHVHQRGKVIRDDKHRATGIQGTMQDITERLKTEQRLLEAKLEAEKATQVKSEFLANMSHEIRTPMNAIVGLVELCLNSNITSKQRDYLERVETAAHGLMKLIDDILDFSKMESGKLRLEPVPFLLNEMLDQVFSTMAELCHRKHLRLIRPRLDQIQPAVVGDPQRLRQILINLLGNAIKFTEQGYVEVSLTELNRSLDKTTLQFSITDTGIGMSEQQQSRLFQAFSQGDSSVTRNYGGTGLGLVICKQLVESMGGKISVTSRPQAGSCFSFTVILDVAEIESIRQFHPQQRQDVDTRQLQQIQGARVLLVEDNEVNRLVASELLRQALLQVDTAENGEIALIKLQHNRYDCVLMDVQMPVMDGYETTRHLRKLPGCADLPVIAITANVMNTDRNKCLQAGMDDFIGKPILPETLYAVLIKRIRTQHGKPQASADSPTPADDLPYLYGIDNRIGLQHTADDKTVFRKILQKFAENHANSMNEIEQALSENHIAAAQQLVHTLKGLAGSLGAIPLQGHLQRLEESLAESGSNIQNTPTINRLAAATRQELQRVVNSIQSTLPASALPLKPRQAFTASETRRHLGVLLDKLQMFDSDADRQLDLVLSGIADQTLIAALLSIRKQIANYQFEGAARALKRLLDFPES